MEIEIIYGQVIAKANNYQAVPGKDGQKRIIKNDRIGEYEKSFCLQCKKYRGKRISGRFKLFIRVWHGNIRFDLDNALKRSLIACKWWRLLQMTAYVLRFMPRNG